MQNKQKPFWEKIAAQLLQIWDDVIQIAVYNTGLSDQGSLVVVLEDDSLVQVVKAHSVVKEINRKGINPPLIISPHYIEHSLDSFPLEFLNIKTDYYNIHAKHDAFKDLRFEKSYIRLEMERELKSKELLIKMNVLDYYGHTKILKELIEVSFATIEPILKGLLFLLDEYIPIKRKELIYKADEVTEFDISSLLMAVDFITGTAKLPKERLKPFFDKYTQQLQTLSDYIELFKLH